MVRQRDIPIEERLLSRRLITPEGCWLWTGPVNADGYAGIGYLGRRNVGIHVVAHLLWVGPLGGGMTVDHLCHTNDPTCPGGRTCLHRRCFNPTDLEAVDHTENVLRGRGPTAVNAAKTHCIHGHALTPDNVYPRRDNPEHRQCKTCMLARSAAWKQRQREQAARRSA